MALVTVLSACVVSVVVVAIWRRAAPARCPEGRVALQHRCCLVGQSMSDGRCSGVARRCAPPYVQRAGGCGLNLGPVRIPSGELRVGPNDWQAQGLVEERISHVKAFHLDPTEWVRGSADEPWLPVTGVAPTRAEALCRERGGRLPTVDEWMFAAAGPGARRFPWGQTGLVCRRAVYGLVHGPCASSAHGGPDEVASRPDGATPSGLFDMVGNVAEWAREGDRYFAMGGSFRSEVASELKTWSRRLASPGDDIGFRCAYDVR